MLKGKVLENYAELVLKIGVNLQKNQGLEIICPVEKSYIAEALAKKAYEVGAKLVHVRWEDEEIDRINYMNAKVETLCDIPQWFVESKNFLIKENYCYVAIAAENPSVFKDVPAEKISAASNARRNKLKPFFKQVMANGIRWCVVSVPTLEWAKQVFPSSDNPEEDLSTAIEKTMRLDKEDPVKEWKNHISVLQKRADFMNKKNFEYLRYTSANGTDIKVGLAINHMWVSANEKAQDGIPFVANMPTEEVFTSPHNKKIDGTVKSALPLSYNGQIVDNFSITFKGGKVVDFSAEKGYDVLKHLIETDKGTLSLGEVALIGKNSPIAESGILYFNTLFDENASCHFALGKAYPTTIKNGAKMSMTELKALGVNDSVEHVDFMIGTPDMNITGIGFDKKETPIFIDGEWVI